MKAFLKKLLLFLLAFALFAGAANLAFYLYMGRMTPTYADQFTQIPDRIEVANLGSSHGANAFCYDVVPGVAAANLGFGAQSLEYDVRMLENYIDRFQTGSTLYVPISYFTFMIPPLENGSFYSLNRRYYFFLSRKLIIGFSWTEWLAAKLPGLYLPNWFTQYWNKDEFSEAGKQVASDTDVTAHAKFAVNDHVFGHITASGYDFRPENTAYVKTIIRLCREHGVTPVLITTPFLKEYNDQVPDDFLLQQRAVIDRICAEENVEYLDFSHDSRFTGRYDLFVNSDHLNHNGALIFTDLLLSGEKPEKCD